MTSILIEAAKFPQAERLCASVAIRKISAEVVKAPAEGSVGAVWAYSADYEEVLGGQQALLNIARAQKPKCVVVFKFGADKFSIVSSLGGKLLRVSLPEDEGFELTVAAEILAADISKMVAADPATSQMLSLASRVATSDVTVFVNGPTGTGKEVLARYIHDRSDRAEAPFVAINCAAIPENMLEAVLFGHEKGAFTGASVANKGIFRAADRGTLLLDEISEMPLGLQSKLLRVLQERKVTPLGAQAEIEVDVRVLATTNRDMRLEIQENRFREDLFYRLNVFPMSTQALSARPLDILPLAIGLLRKHASSIEAIPWITAEARSLLISHEWPGNVRELENVIQRALVLQVDGMIQAEDIIIDGARIPHVMPSPTNPHPALSRLSS
ncbi:sigma 54-interacting transcriptional regulator [uncultured Lentibacter sp.]|uniref:sigma 54-interacting transcriptional regulator n=1 Tax=uncultured Lentibacter sp. TaxID=1659309 RepID=UPI002620EEF9|nr:sigma-54 dependent transcriptional regulator [uncultured Lentibacter sp.]